MPEAPEVQINPLETFRKLFDSVLKKPVDIEFQKKLAYWEGRLESFSPQDQTKVVMALCSAFITKLEKMKNEV